MGFSNTEELDNAITTCIKLVKTAEDGSQRKKDLTAQLVQLRLKLHELKVTYPLIIHFHENISGIDTELVWTEL